MGANSWISKDTPELSRCHQAGTIRHCCQAPSVSTGSAANSCSLWVGRSTLGTVTLWAGSGYAAGSSCNKDWPVHTAWHASQQVWQIKAACRRFEMFLPDVWKQLISSPTCSTPAPTPPPPSPPLPLQESVHQGHAPCHIGLSPAGSSGMTQRLWSQTFQMLRCTEACMS